MAMRTGRVWIELNGVLQESMSGAKAENIGGIQRTPVEGSDVYGHTEEVKAPHITCSFPHGPGISLKSLNAFVDGVLMFVCDSGPIFTIVDAFNMKADLNGKNVDAEFGGVQSTETGASDSTSAD
jgi:hypothetical protein